MIDRNRILQLVVTAAAFWSAILVSPETIWARPAQRTPTPTPTPVSSPLPASALKPKQPLAELQSRIRGRLDRPEVRRGRLGVRIITLATGKVVFEQDAEKYFMPASNMKNFTIAAALEKLGPDFRFVTGIYAPSAPDANGTVKGDLRLVGRGDISLSAAFYDGDHFRGLDALADKIISAGVRRIEGDLVGDESYFTGHAIPMTWEVEDITGYYGTEISALPLNDNAIDVGVSPGPAGYPCSVRLVPSNTVFRVLNKCLTSPAGTKRELKIVKSLDQNVIEISGSVAVGDIEFKESIAVTHPAELFISMLHQRLELKGVTITGNARVTNVKPSTVGCAMCPANQSVEIGKLESPPLSLIAAKTMKPSQNMYTETILWTLGEQIGRSAGATGDSARLGLSVVKDFLTSIGIPQDGVVQYDGSGLSRRDLITPSAVVTLYTYMAKQSRNAQAWRESLTVGAVDGTLKNRFKGTAASGNIRGKTGTIDQVSALSGYLTTAGGEILVLSIIVNGVPAPRDRTSLIDDIVIQLANYDGSID